MLPVAEPMAAHGFTATYVMLEKFVAFTEWLESCERISLKRK